MTTTIYITQDGSCSPWSITWTETVVYVGRVCVWCLGVWVRSHGGSYIHSYRSVLLVGSSTCGCYCLVPWTQPARRSRATWGRNSGEWPCPLV